MLSPVHLSVCPSVTRVDQSKRLIMQFSRYTPFLWHKFYPEILTGSHERGRQTKVMGKQAVFLALCVSISKTVRDTY